MNKYYDLTGQRFGKLTVIELDIEESTKRKRRYWKCKCDCGNEKTINESHLLKKNGTRSCGCLHKSAISRSNEYYLYEEYGFGIGFFNGRSSNEFFVFDIEDFDCIKDRCWYKTGDGYVRAKIRCYQPNDVYNKEQFLHREIMRKYYGDNINNYMVDHINHNKLDNRKYNLRLCDAGVNNRNRKSPKEGSNTGYRNIHYKERDDLYEFSIKLNKQSYHKGFKSLDDVIKYRDNFYKEHNIDNSFYNKEEDYRFSEDYMGFYINDVHEHIHPGYIVNRNCMIPPNPNYVQEAFEKVSIINPFEKSNIIEPFIFINKNK